MESLALTVLGTDYIFNPSDKECRGSDLTGALWSLSALEGSASV